MQIIARSTAVSGSMFGAAIQIRSKTAATVPVESVSIVNLLITRGGQIVGRQLGRQPVPAPASLSHRRLPRR